MVNVSLDWHEDDTFSVTPPVKCFYLKLIGLYCVILFVLCLLANSFLIWVFIKFKELQAPINRLLMSLIALNFIGTLVELPFVIISAFQCRFTFGKSGCHFQAFIMYFTGISTIYLLTVISYERYWLVLKPFRTFKRKTWIKLLCGIFLMSTFWACAPMVGWSMYSLEGAMISCSIEWRMRSFSVTSYNAIAVLFVYFIPLCILVYTTTRTILIIKSARRTLNLNKRTIQFRRRFRRETHLVVVIILLALIFFACWSPYAVMNMLTTFYDNNLFGPLAVTIPGLIAKSSLLWPALLNIFGNKQISTRIILYFKLNGKIKPLLLFNT